MVPVLWSQCYGPSTMVPVLWSQHYGPSAMVPALFHVSFSSPRRSSLSPITPEDDHLLDISGVTSTTGDMSITSPQHNGNEPPAPTHKRGWSGVLRWQSVNWMRSQMGHSFLSVPQFLAAPQWGVSTSLHPECWNLLTEVEERLLGLLS